MFGLKAIISSTLRAVFVKNPMVLTNTTAVRNAARNTYIPHTRGLFAHETCPRGNQYKPNVKKRIATYGLATRLQSRGGKQMLWRKILKGKQGWITFVPAP